MHLKDKVAIVTGGAGGLGHAMTVAMLEKGAKVCVFDYNEGRGTQMTSELQENYEKDCVSFFKCDVSSEKSFTDAFSAAVGLHGNIDIIVNNAAVVHEWRDVDEVLLVNLGGVIRGSNLSIKHMRKDEGGKGGVIINVSSIGGVEPFHALPSYVATKHGIVGFTRSWASNPYLKKMGLRFALLCPGNFRSYITEDVEEQLLYAQDHIAIANTKMGLQDPKDIADGLIDLLEDDDSNDVILMSSQERGNYRQVVKLVDEQQ